MAETSVQIRCSERRTQPRFPGERIGVTLRVRGRWTKQSAEVIDFNRFGMSVLVERPLDPSKALCLSLQLGPIRLPDLRAVVHNCRMSAGRVDGKSRYRCGIQFRTDAKDQFDRNEVEHLLETMEKLTQNL